MKKNLILSAVFGAVMVASAAGAATLDFVGYANSGEKGVPSGTTIVFDGVPVTFSATKGGKDAYPYFDAATALEISEGRGAGLGVCGTLGTLNGKADQCIPSNDDNVTGGGSGGNEAVTIAFDTAQILENLLFNAEGHAPIADGLRLLFGINGDDLAVWTFGALRAASFGYVKSATFAFYDNRGGDQFYVAGATVSPIPLPAGGLLLLTGLAGLAAARRRKSA